MLVVVDNAVVCLGNGGVGHIDEYSYWCTIMAIMIVVIISGVYH